LVEHLVCNQAVVGSNPVASTKTLARLAPRVGGTVKGSASQVRREARCSLKTR
jgi:hypothetical protein